MLGWCDRILIFLRRAARSAARSAAEVLPSLLILPSVVGKSVCFLDPMDFVNDKVFRVKDGAPILDAWLVDSL